MNNDIENLNQENPVFKAPYLIFDKEKREEAREQVSSLGGVETEGDERCEVIGLVIRYGLYEYYSDIPELSKPLKIDRIFNYISSKEKNPDKESLKKLELRRLYWKHVLYPEAVRQIVNGTVYEEGKDNSWLFTSTIINVNPPDEFGESRGGYLYNLIKYYKSCESEVEREAIKRFLARQVGDYPL
jgi:hypothetical protein